MKITVIGITGLCAVLLSGCDGAAREFATKAAALLREYESQLSAEIGESEQYYRQYAAVEADSLRRRNVENEGVVRREMADKWSADYIEQKRNAVRLREQLLEAAKAQFEVSQRRWLNDVDEGRIYLEKVEKLQADKEKVEALGKLLDSLAKKRSLADQGEEIRKFVEATKEDLDVKICKELKIESANANTPADRKQALIQLMNDRKCKQD